MKSVWVGLGLLCWCLQTLLLPPLLAQCDCGGPCGSGCLCGCNSSDNAEPQGPKELIGFTSSNVDLLGRLSLTELGVGTNVLGNDCWGWTDSASGREFALFGMTNGTAFVEITDPFQPRHLGTLPTAHGNDTWRDIKVYQNRAYIVADGSNNTSHGVQVFDLTRLLNLSGPPQTFTQDARYTGLGRAHNIAINETTGFAYVIGSPSQSSSGGPIILDLKRGILPVFVRAYAADGYTHDTQVVRYHGPDNQVSSAVQANTYVGREIAFCSNEDTLTIVDVTSKRRAPVMISRNPYVNSRYSHQGWLSEDHRYFFMDDELDEQSFADIKTRTHVWDVQNLDQPVYVGFVNGTERTIDHNLYVHDGYIYEANYSSGLRILKIVDPANLNLPEAGFFDTYPANNNVSFNGAWSCYPYFPSGNTIVSDRQNGLFIVRFYPPD